eukprot:5725647-Amphidinium_carterae.1
MKLSLELSCEGCVIYSRIHPLFMYESQIANGQTANKEGLHYKRTLPHFVTSDGVGVPAKGEGLMIIDKLSPGRRSAKKKEEHATKCNPTS